ncbi:MFS transporter [Aspergillus rambellii]|uniref:MFS transporter n=3 Tax=Aspergillus subgen. Nidulantes TaxID=2720870 RepID=A0A0F8VSQ7_9EURO|nr:MFS transporter [Aspergillus ochraceoroseus]KKK26266.1 MFS transporter [Aspergillus rambellii]
MADSTQKAKRIVTVVAATLVALACGTNYAYSAWAPQFAHQMKLSSTTINFIGAGGNLGMYACGIPLGVLTDNRGPRLTTFIAVICLGLGYFPLHLAYVGGEGSMAVFLLAFFCFLTGFGGCSGFSAAIKTAATNFPEHRGTATAFPLAAFGLSAFFWSTLSAILFNDNTGKFLLLLALGTSLLTFACLPFMRLLPPSKPYQPVSRPRSVESRPFHSVNPTDFRSDLEPTDEAGTQHSTIFESYPAARDRSHPAASHSHSFGQVTDQDELSSLVSKTTPRTSQEILNEFDEEDDDHLPDIPLDSHHPDIRGLAILRKIEFWQLFMTMALLSGIGLMTINNIGNGAKALWEYYDNSATSKFIQQRQVMNVSVLSFGNFIGRLSSGIGSDILHKFGLSRFWCLFISASVFTLTQLAGASISNPNHLVLVSGFTGVAYGFLFGVFPSLTAHTFGIAGLSQNFGVMTLAPVFSGNIFNLLYGSIYDHHSIVRPDGERDCTDGLACYQSAYYMTFFSGVGGILVCLWTIWREKRLHGPAHAKFEHDRLA